MPHDCQHPSFSKTDRRRVEPKRFTTFIENDWYPNGITGSPDGTRLSARRQCYRWAEGLSKCKRLFITSGNPDLR